MIGRLLSVVVLAVMLVGCGDDDQSSTATSAAPPATTATAGSTGLELVVDGFTRPVQTVALPGDPAELWVVEQQGVVRAVRGGRVSDTLVADLRNSTASNGEQGLLALALHPNFPATDLAYLHRSDVNGDTLVTEHRVDAGRIDDEPTRVLLQVRQPFSNHNGGTLAFGPDGLLYLGLGDGGSANDPQGAGQDMTTRLGKLLRYDLAGGGEWEIAAYGLRNPWRFSFDPVTGDGWIGDVGQSQWEEINVFPNGAGIRNYGWSAREGAHDFSDGGNDALVGPGQLTDPVVEYSHDEGCSVTGGVVVRDAAVPSLDDRYLFADYCSGTFWSVPASGRAVRRKESFRVDSPVSFDATPDGTVYVTSHSGGIYRLQPAAR